MMGNLNQRDFLIENLELARGPVLEIGSKDYGNTNDFRAYFGDRIFVGVDREPGKGVDKVCNFTDDYAVLKEQIGQGRFGTVICFSVMEHCANPFKMSENISLFLEEGGHLLLSVPFVWNIHAFPEDYWRFTPAALPVLFPSCVLLKEKSFYSTKIRGEKFPLDYNLEQLGSSSASRMSRLIRRLGVKRKYPYSLVPVLVNGVLQKTAT